MKKCFYSCLVSKLVEQVKKNLASCKILCLFQISVKSTSETVASSFAFSREGLNILWTKSLLGNPKQCEVHILYEKMKSITKYLEVFDLRKAKFEQNELIYCELLYQCGSQPFMFSTQTPAVKCSERIQYCGIDGDKAKAILCINYKVKLGNIQVVCNFCIGLRLLAHLGASFHEML